MESIFKKRKYIFSTLLLFLIYIQTTNVFAKEEKGENYEGSPNSNREALFNGLNEKLENVKEVAQPFLYFISGAVLLTTIFAFIVNMVKLAKSSPNERAEILHNIMVIAIILAILGSLNLVLFLSFAIYAN